MYSMVKHALAEHDSTLAQSRSQPDFDKDEILTAVRSACEDFKPEIELQQYGLERDEILDVLKEGLAEYRSGNTSPDSEAINKQEVYQAMSEALQSVQLPAPTFDVHAIREEMLASIRECLEDFRATSGGVSSLEEVSTRELINDAIRSGLAEQSDMTSRVMEISRDDLFDAVKAGLDGSSIPFGGFGEQVLQQLHILVDGMKAEFKQYSAANGRDTEQVLDAVKDGLEILRGQIETYVDRAQDVTGKDEIIESLRTGLDSLRMDFQNTGQDGSVHHRQDLLDYIKSEFEHLHTIIGANPGGKRDAEGLMSDTSDIMAAMTGIRSDLGASRSFSGSDLDTTMLESVRGDIAHLRDALGPLLIKLTASNDKEDMIHSIREAMAGLPSHGGVGISPEVLEAIHGEFEKLQRTISSSGGTEEMLDAIRLGLDDLRSHVDKKIESPDKHILNGEILDALNEGLDNLRTDVSKTLEKPVDMTVTYEILDTLKEGLAGLRADMDKLAAGRPRGFTPAGGQIVLADSNELSRDAVAENSPELATTHGSSSLDEVKLLLTKLQIKVEAIDKNMQDLPVPSEAPVEPLGGLEASLKEIQAAVAMIAAREKTEMESTVTKEDTNAIETLLRNTKAEVESTASREQLDAVEAVSRVIKDTTDAMKLRIDEHVATKADIAVVEVLAADLKVAMDELRGKTGHDSGDGPLTKAHVDALGVMCAEIKDKVLDMVLNNAETLPEKSDIEQLGGLINDLRDNHEKFRETYDKDIGVTAQAFDDRKKDTEEILVAVTTIKGLVEEFKNQACDQEESQHNSFDALNETLAGISETLEGQPEVAAGVRSLAEELKADLGKAQLSLDMLKVDHGEGLDKQAEHRDTVIAVVTKKMDERIDELLIKNTNAEKLAAEHTLAQAAAVLSTRELADELKLSIDTLGTTLTTSATGLGEATEKMSADSKTVFNRVDDVFNKVDETQLGLMGEHQATRQEVVKIVEGISTIQSELLEHNPKVLVSLQELHALVNRHYEHAQKVGGEHSEALKVHADELKANLTNPRLMPASAEATTPATAAAFDDSALHQKLDTLISREVVLPADTTTLLEKLEMFTAEVASPSAQLERLDAIHAQMMATAAEVSTFVSAQTDRIADSHASRECEAEELTAQIARHETRKEDLEADIDVLVSERDELRDALAKLKQEREDMAAQNSRLAADVHAMHAALAIRREELSAMEVKADALERRVVEGLMDQSRLALLGRSLASSGGSIAGTSASPSKTTMTNRMRRPKGRDLRVSSAANSEASAVTASSAAMSTLGAAMEKITSVRTNGARQSIAPGTTVDSGRRIMSPGQIHHNAVSNGARPSLAGATQTLSASPRGIEALKRSQSVRTSGLGLANGRKSSWSGGVKAFSDKRRGFTPMGGIIDLEGDKENGSAMNPYNDRDVDDSRRESTVSFSLAPSSMHDDSRPCTSGGRSEMSEGSCFVTESGRSSGTFSTVTASEVASSLPPTSDDSQSTLSRNDSLIASMLAGRVREMLEGGEVDPDCVPSELVDHGQGGGGMPPLLLTAPGVGVVDYALDGSKSTYYPDAPTDSGLGSDLPTACGNGAPSDGYFDGTGR